MDEPSPLVFKQKLHQKLKSTESPFTWLPDRTIFYDIRSNYIIEQSERKPHDDNFSIFSNYMRRIFEMENNNDPSTMQNMEEWEHFYNEVVDSDQFFIKYKMALEHVLYSSKAHLLLKMQKYSQVEQLIESIGKLNDRSNSFKGGIRGLKAKFFYKYCNEGCLKALPYAKEAIELDPEEPEWIKLTALTMRNKHRRHLEDSKESREEELKLLEELSKISGKEIHLIYLGKAYIDFGSYLKKGRNHRCARGKFCEKCHEIKMLYFKGVKCFKEAIRRKLDLEQRIYVKVVEGISYIPFFYRTEMFKETAKDCVNRIMDDIQKQNVDPNDYEVYYALGKYYEQIEKDPKKCFEYMSESAKRGGRKAKKEIICMKYNQNSSYDPEDDVKELMDIYQRGPCMVQCVCQLASYYLLKNDLLKASEYIIQSKEYDPSFNYSFVKEIRSWFNEKRIVNLLEDMKSRAKSRLNELGDEDTSEEKEKLTNFMMVVGEDAREIVT